MRRASQSFYLGVLWGVLIHHLQATREELVRIEKTPIDRGAVEWFRQYM